MLSLIQKSFYSTPSFAFGTRTLLYNYQKNVVGGTIVDFCGYEMPVKFKTTSLIQEHMQCRQKAVVFDVSHMGEVHLHGKDREKFLESICTADVKEMKAHSCLYSVLPNKKGGVIDDFIISKMPKYINLVVNAGTTKKDLAHINNELQSWTDKDVHIEHIQFKGLIALQGPWSQRVLQKLIKEDLSKLYFMHIGTFTFPKINERILLRRSGYTGEDGFELSVTNKNLEKVYDLLLRDPDVKPAGLGARDTLRLESGMCLYGHEINDEISPIEAGLNWAIGKRRKKEGGFPSYDIFKRQMKKGGVDRKRVGLMFDKGAVPREQTPICDKDGNELGMITSGTFSPSLKKPIAMGYVPTDMTKLNTQFYASIRKNLYPCKVTKLPFVANNYYRDDAKI